MTKPPIQTSGQTADGTTYQRFGQASGPAVADRYDVITYDLFGHGSSAAPPETPETPSLDIFSKQLQRLMGHCGIESAAIAGFSLGGMIARPLAMDAPCRVQALGILNSAHRRSKAAQTAIELRVKQAATDGPAAAVEDALVRWFSDGYRPANPAMMDLARGWVLANDPAIYPDVTTFCPKEWPKS